MTEREELLAALAAYHDAVASGTKSEAEVDALLGQAVDMVPNARLTDIVFWGERERSNVQMVDEALHREQLWRQGGELAILLHIRETHQTALNESVPDDVGEWIEHTLDSATKEIEAIRARRH